MSQAADNHKCGIDYHYEYRGEMLTYNGDSFLVLIDDQQSGIQVSGNGHDEVEVLSFKVRRYTQVDCSGETVALGPSRIKVGDKVEFDDNGELKSFTVNVMPRHVDGHRLESSVMAERDINVRLGSTQVRPLGNRF